ncbi:hypothetical protein [Porphyromonas sp.]|uniref:hypothetical protein n=1 Tax=Porphyromonas sp. TaxID=1924944 RepID=UPI0026DDB105|nr:hypothetical protein [Porphyromonas sp.]MDO4695295.1 hypothetical protein [Porphyromonas sp.]MDO4771042.1 hypothetical protein [Porphyromonas sp.]
MKRYTSEKVDSLLNKMDEELPVLKAIKRQKKLEEEWKKISDTTLKRLDIKASIDSEGVLRLLCPSTVSLDYVKRQRPLIEERLANFMEEWEISHIHIILA